jgi:hypothetical protein
MENRKFDLIEFSFLFNNFSFTSLDDEIDYFYYMWRIGLGIALFLILVACYYRAIVYVFYEIGREPQYTNRDGDGAEDGVEGDKEEETRV